MKCGKDSFDISTSLLYYAPTRNSSYRLQLKLFVVGNLGFHAVSKVIHPKYSKHWLYTVAHIIDCVCSKILNHGLNHGLFLSLFKFFVWKYSKLNKFRIKRTRMLHCFRSQVFTWNTSYSDRNQPILICPNDCAEQLFVKCL